MKKALVGFLCLSVIVCLNACGENGNSDSVMENVSDDSISDNDTSNDESQEAIFTGIGNPVHESSYEEILSLDGIALQIPDESETEKTSWVRIVTGDGVIDEVSFYYDYSFFVCRAKKTEALEDISGMYYEWSYVSAYNQPNCQQIIQQNNLQDNQSNSMSDAIQEGAPTIYTSDEGPGIIIGYQNGYSYSIAMPVEADDEKLVSMWQIFVEGESCPR